MIITAIEPAPRLPLGRWLLVYTRLEYNNKDGSGASIGNSREEEAVETYRPLEEYQGNSEDSNEYK